MTTSRLVYAEHKLVLESDLAVENEKPGGGHAERLARADCTPQRQAYLATKNANSVANSNRSIDQFSSATNSRNLAS